MRKSINIRGALAGQTGAEGLARDPTPAIASRPARQDGGGAVLRLIVSSAYDPARCAGPEFWRVELETGEVLLGRARVPLLEGARALVARGVDPETPITTRYRGKEHDNYEPPVRLGTAARYTVSEPAERSLHFRKWRPGPEMPAACGGGGEKPASEDTPVTYPAEKARSRVAEGAR